MFNLMGERRDGKGRGENTHRELNRRINGKCREAKEKCPGEQCEKTDLENRVAGMTCDKTR